MLRESVDPSGIGVLDLVDEYILTGFTGEVNLGGSKIKVKPIKDPDQPKLLSVIASAEGGHLSSEQLRQLGSLNYDRHYDIKEGKLHLYRREAGERSNP